MSLSHITSHSLRRVLSLTEKKEQLLKVIEDVESEIAKVLHGTVTSMVEVAEAVTPFKPAKAKGKKTRKAKSGGLKDRILALLHDAGDQGLKVKEIAEKLATKPANIAVWFSTTGKKLATKVEPGRYAVKGAKPSVVAKVEVKAPAKAAAPKKKATKKPKKAAKPARKGFKLKKAATKTA